MSDNYKLRIRVISIRKKASNGIMFSGYPFSNFGYQDNSRLYVVKAIGKEYTDIQIGELWEVHGELTSQVIVVNGIEKREPLIITKSMFFLKPSGNQIIRWISENSMVKGIGGVKAQNLWDQLGELLYRALDENNPNPILSVINNPDIVNSLLYAWSIDGDTKTLKWMQDHKIPLSLSRKFIKYHGRNSLDALKDDPYRLLSFCASWDFVENLAKNYFHIKNDDPRRLQAAAEEVLYRQMAKGHTCLEHAVIKERLNRFLKDRQLASLSVETAHNNKSIKLADSKLYSAGAWIMERSVAEYISNSVNMPYQLSLSSNNTDQLIDEFELNESKQLGIEKFSLNHAQRRAITRSFKNRFSIITGGAGVGKTTVLKALYHLFDCVGMQRYQMALSGRAAKRMSEATDEKSYTIANFLKNVSSKKLGTNPLVVIDEASMVDLASMYRLIRKIPLNSHIVLVGDPHQLPPISAGLILNCLVDSKHIPVSELTEVKRQAEDSYIPKFSQFIRDGIWPEEMLCKETEKNIRIIPCNSSGVVKTVLELYDEDKHNTQILSSTNANPFSGCKAINRLCCFKYSITNGAKPLTVYDEPTGFFEGDLLLYTKNDWDRDIQNGSLGTLIEVFNEPKKMIIGENGEEHEVLAFGWADWDNRRVPILESDIEAIVHGYAVTVHKAQGSQFNRVILPITKGYSDRTLLYTAITRAVDQVVIVGDIEFAKNAVSKPPTASLRSVGLPGMLLEYLSLNEDRAA